MRGQDIARLVALAAIWGASFIFMRVLAPTLGPVATAASRVLIAGVALITFLRVAGIDADLRRFWRQYLVIGIVNSSVPFVLFSFAALHLPASYSAILNATTPMMSALLSTVFLDERLTAAKLAGLASGIAGVVLVSRAGPVVPDAMFALSVAACLAATICYAASGIYLKKRAGGAASMAIAGWSQVFAGLALVPMLPIVPVTGTIDAAVVANVLALSLLCSAVAYVLYYRLIVDLGPTRALTVAFVIPVFGMLWGALFLGETITVPMIAGCALIVAGTGAVLKPAKRAT